MEWSPLELRKATRQDVDAVVALVQAAYRGDASRAGWTTEADLLQGQRTDAEAVRAAVAARSTVVLVGEQAGALITCAQLTHLPPRPPGPEVAEFGMFCVRPGAQGGGLGGQVLSGAERIAQQLWGVERMEMLVIRQRTELIAWYHRRGYEPTGETRPFPYGEERYGLPTRDDLEFVVLAKALSSAPTLRSAPGGARRG